MKALYLALLLLTLSLPTSLAARDNNAYTGVQNLLATDQTIIGEPLAYPPGKAKITAIIVTVMPGEETALHKHGAPLFAYILSGEATLDYGDKGMKVFPAGSAFVEAMDQWHRGMNKGTEPVRILAVFLGSDQVDNVILEESK